MEKKILLTDCPDAKGLIAKITNICYKHQLNINKNDEFVDHENGRFFMRTELEGRFNDETLLADLDDALPAGAQRRLVKAGKKRIVILVTKETHCLGDILMKNYAGALDMDIVAVIGNRELARQKLADDLLRFRVAAGIASLLALALCVAFYRSYLRYEDSVAELINQAKAIGAEALGGLAQGELQVGGGGHGRWRRGDGQRRAIGQRNKSDPHAGLLRFVRAAGPGGLHHARQQHRAAQRGPCLQQAPPGN